MNKTRIGGVAVDRDAAVGHARRYLTAGTGWACPAGLQRLRARPGHRARDRRGPSRTGPAQRQPHEDQTYEALQAKRAELDEHLARVPPGLDLADAGTDDLAVLGEMFAVLVGPGSGARRERSCPRSSTASDGASSRFTPGRSAGATKTSRTLPCPWRDFVVLPAAAVQADLRLEADLLLEIAALAPGPSITPRRALDIVAWWAGLPEGYLYSYDMAYRYAFGRWWGPPDPSTSDVWVLLNPATGDVELRRRPTLNRCLARSRAYGLTGVIIVNLFAHRGTSPKGVRTAAPNDNALRLPDQARSASGGPSTRPGQLATRSASPRHPARPPTIGRTGDRTPVPGAAGCLIPTRSARQPSPTYVVCGPGRENDRRVKRSAAQWLRMVAAGGETMAFTPLHRPAQVPVGATSH